MQKNGAAHAYFHVLSTVFPKPLTPPRTAPDSAKLDARLAVALKDRDQFMKVGLYLVFGLRRHAQRAFDVGSHAN